MSAEPSRRRTLLRRPAVLLGAVAAGIVLGVVADVVRHGGIEPWLNRSAPVDPVDVPPYVARGRSVEVDGRGVYLDCRGERSNDRPTVILEAGFGSGAGSWGHVLDGVAAFSRVCAWDRPGLGRSEGRGRHSPGEALDDLWRALGAAGERGPYVVAGHSFGGVYARILAAQRPGEVAALLMIDAYYPDVGIEDDPALPAGFRDGFRRSLADTAAMLAGGEDLDWPRVMEELRAATPFEGPAIMLSVDQRARFADPDPAVQAAIVGAWEAAVRAQFPNGTLEIVPATGHLMQFDVPSVVIDRIRQLVEVVASGAGVTPQRSP